MKQGIITVRYYYAPQPLGKPVFLKKLLQKVQQKGGFLYAYQPIVTYLQIATSPMFLLSK